MLQLFETNLSVKTLSEQVQKAFRKSTNLDFKYFFSRRGN